MSEQLISITDNAKEYLRDLIEKQGNPGMGVRIFVERPGTPHAECCMAYCPPGEQEENDVRYDYEGFHAWIEGKSVRYLEDASIDFKKDSMGGQLTFRAPKSRVPDIGPEATLEERINHVLYAEINPSLASHGGNVQLLELTDDNVAILEFGGGCQGCSAVDMTLKSGVEKTLKERIPELTAVRDKTDHSVRDNAYFR
ncbi:Fe-S biogenesis protein NfuA [Alcanivorax sp. 1008]|uniref:Fe-S biogenesis protein NfuA n=1 Tax=Alcanivorax sp. 1008 TaxID=2816853 RepID=UPI001D9853CB|nr:Fe-S biogenesis protein NfuA [Alcanivorax sp. 1008]MCC1496417.1 Fe-S biogenesis protein NfuA [Alcanivorax sp. 1008]